MLRASGSHIESALLFIMSYSVTIPFGRRTGTQYKHYSSHKGQAQENLFHVHFQIGYFGFILRTVQQIN